LELHRASSNRRFAGIHGADHALCLLVLGRPQQARQAWQQAAATLRAIGDVDWLQRKTEEMRQACQNAGATPLDEQAER
jgi:hypothetical protein